MRPAPTPRLLLLLPLLGWACAPVGAAPLPGWTSPPAPARPTACTDVPAGADLQAALDAAPEGAALCLQPGRYAGPLHLSRPVTLWGPASASVVSSGQGTTVVITGREVALLGFTIDGSGGRYDATDAALRLGGEGHRVEGLTVRRAVFGITCEQARRVTLRGNHIEGDQAEAMGLRGDAIRLWETTDSTVEGNDVEDGRDLVVWYSPRNAFLHNRVRGGRYGTHFMYSSDNSVEDSRYEGNVVGIFVMYSRNLLIARNLLAGSSGGAGIGLGIKESGNLTVRDNRFVRDTTGIYLDTSPLYDADANAFERNALRLCDAAVLFHAGRAGNTFRDNLLADNRAQLEVEGGGDALASRWEGNHFDDYAGYDLDGDGAGDVPYELRSLTGELISSHPELGFLRGTPALAVAEAVGRLVPLYPPRALLVDQRPRLSGGGPEVGHAD